MTAHRFTLLVIPFAAIAAGAAARQSPSALPATHISVLADTDTVVPGRAEKIAILPLPVPKALKPLQVTACFDVDTVAQSTLIMFTATPDTAYNRQMEQLLKTFRFTSSTRLKMPVRDTICIRAVVGK